MPRIFLCLVLALPLAAQAERATERYAPDQLGVARALLERARAAASLQEYGAAASYAREAELDARLAWGMSEAPALREEAATVGGEARTLARQAALTTSRSDRTAESYPSPSAQALARVPSPD
jgi:hypothetical protein